MCNLNSKGTPSSCCSYLCSRVYGFNSSDMPWSTVSLVFYSSTGQTESLWTSLILYIILYVYLLNFTMKCVCVCVRARARVRVRVCNWLFVVTCPVCLKEHNCFIWNSRNIIMTEDIYFTMCFFVMHSKLLLLIF
jgi:hypothetical protein